MTKKLKYVSIVLFGSGLLVTAGLLLSNYQTRSKVQAAPAAMTHKECIDRAEANYQNYVKTHGAPTSGSYAEKFYSLSDAQEAMINATRASAYTECFNKYGEKLPIPS